ncbi:MAG: hypothetical protein IR164_16910 [Devosia sp.]|uniref:hypothetical protein n=1 Tax=Devosia sp. TaxID=1871048 RepID=UPI0019F7EF52|nr:hypothetical protein [Devosia sp.]MBF0680608.1 hypothetical protein [Devosia sp.]
MSAVALAATVHDPIGRLAEATVSMSGPLRASFARLALNISDATHVATRDALSATADAIMVHSASEAMIGKARRDALALAGTDRPALYTDFDHLLRWLELGPEDLHRVLEMEPALDCLVVGRSDRAFSAEPRRLRDSETLVNHAHALLTGDHWDLMFAVRRLSPRAIALILEQSQVDSLANDVEWPLLARRAGLALGYTQSDALYYRTLEEFGENADSGDDDPLQWIRRLEFAALHASAMRPFLKP